MCQNPASAASETYELNIATFDNGKPKQFLLPMKNFKTAIYRKVITSVSGRINYLRTMLHV